VLRSSQVEVLDVDELVSHKFIILWLSKKPLKRLLRLEVVEFLKDRIHCETSLGN